MFVHGALCVSYSGQCLSSEAWGGRSANRGQCAQACRLPYDLIVDGTRRATLGDRAFLLSPRDLEGYRRIPELMAAGIHGFKIEGRMKSAEYVAAATAIYREAVDRGLGGRAGDRTQPVERKAGASAPRLLARRLGRFPRRDRPPGPRGRNDPFASRRAGRHASPRSGVDWIEIEPDAGAPAITPATGS